MEIESLTSPLIPDFDRMRIVMDSLSPILGRRRFLRSLAAAPFTMPLFGCGGDQSKRVRVGFIPKITGIPYFNACKKGAEEAAKELNLELVYNGPTKAEATPQIELLNSLVSGRAVDVLCVACSQPGPLAKPLSEAREAGIPVITYDADTLPEARDYFVNQATYERVAEMMTDEMADQLSPKGVGEVGILTSSVDAPNQAEWAKRIKAYAARKYPQMKLLKEAEHGEDRDRGISKAKTLIEVEAGLKGIIGLTSVAVPAAAEAVRQMKDELKKENRTIKVTGVSTPRDMKDYVDDGTVEAFILWSPIDLGYLAVFVANLNRKGEMKKDGTIHAGRLGEIKVSDREVLLGEPIRFTKENMGKYDF
jgi:ABC-type sugar transport system substrate-binding protein